MQTIVKPAVIPAYAGRLSGRDDKAFTPLGRKPGCSKSVIQDSSIYTENAIREIDNLHALLLFRRVLKRSPCRHKDKDNIDETKLLA